jgi:hypothetical protein
MREGKRELEGNVAKLLVENEELRSEVKKASFEAIG